MEAGARRRSATRCREQRRHATVPSATQRSIELILMRAVPCLLIALGASTGRAEIFACPAHQGMTRYQNFPCQFSSLDSVPSPPAMSPTAGVPPRASSPALAPQAPAARAATKPTSEAVRPQVLATARNEPGPGMSEDDVRKVWGEPEEIIQDEPVSGRIEIWRFRNGRSVQFNRRRQVVTVQP